MRVLTAKEVNFVSGGHIDGQADPYSLSGGFQGTGMPNTSGNSIGDVNYSPPSQEQSCLNGNFVMGAGSLISTVNSVVGGILVALGLGSNVANGCFDAGGGDSSDSSSGSDSGGSCTAPSTDGGG